MSIKAVEWALHEAAVVPGGNAVRDRLVLVYLANRYNDDTGVCWPSVPTIVGHLGIGDKTVRRALKSLREQGLIAHGPTHFVEHLPADARPNVWRLVMTCNSSERLVTGDHPNAGVDSADQSRLVTGDHTDWSRVTTKPEENLNREPEGTAGVKAVINQATAPTNPAPSSVDELAAQHFSSEKHPGAYGTPDNPRCRNHRNEPPGWFEPCSGCRQAKDIFINQAQAEARAATEATYQRQMDKDECGICDQAGFRDTYNPRTGLTSTTKCYHAPADQLDQQTAQAHHNAA